MLNRSPHPSPTPSLGALHRLGEIADGLAQADCRRAIDATLETLEHGLLKVAVLGQFKRGKSSLLNALVGRSVLPTGILPLTTVATEIREGPGELLVQSVGGSVEREPLDRLPEFVSEAANPENRRGIERVEVRIPLPGWARDVVFVDTPGVGSVHDATTRAAYRLLEGVEAVVFVLSPDPAISDAELEFLRRAREYATRFFFVMNKIDLVAPEDLETLLRYTERTLAERAGVERPRLYLLSARAATRLAATASPVERAVTGVDVLARDLGRYLGEERWAAAAAVADRRIAQYARRLLTVADLSLRASWASRQRWESALTALDRAIDELRTERRAADALLEQDVDTAVQVATAQLARFQESERTPVVAGLETFLRSSGTIGSGRFVREFDARFRELVAPPVAEMRASLEKEFAATLRAGFARYSRRMQSLARQVESAAGESFDVRLAPMESEGELPSLPGYRANVAGLLEGTFAGQTVLLLPAAVVRSRLRGRLPRLVSEELDAQAGRIRSDLVERGHRAIEEFRREMFGEVERTVASIEAAVRTGWDRDRSSANGRDEWVHRVEDWRTELGSLLGTPDGRPAVRPPTPEGGEGRARA